MTTVDSMRPTPSPSRIFARKICHTHVALYIKYQAITSGTFTLIMAVLRPSVSGEDQNVDVIIKQQSFESVKYLNQGKRFGFLHPYISAPSIITYIYRNNENFIMK